MIGDDGLMMLRMTVVLLTEGARDGGERGFVVVANGVRVV